MPRKRHLFTQSMLRSNDTVVPCSDLKLNEVENLQKLSFAHHQKIICKRPGAAPAMDSVRQSLIK